MLSTLACECNTHVSAKAADIKFEFECVTMRPGPQGICLEEPRPSSWRLGLRPFGRAVAKEKGTAVAKAPSRDHSIALDKFMELSHCSTHEVHEQGPWSPWVRAVPGAPIPHAMLTAQAARH